MKLKRELWWALWGFFIGFLIQVLLVNIGVYSNKDILFFVTLSVVVIFLVVLIVFARFIFSKRKAEDEISKRLNDREFQLELESIKHVTDSFNAFLIAMIAVAVSWIATLVTLSLNNSLKSEAVINLLESALTMVLLIIAVGLAFLIYNFMYVPWKFGKLREQNRD